MERTELQADTARGAAGLVAFVCSAAAVCHYAGTFPAGGGLFPGGYIGLDALLLLSGVFLSRAAARADASAPLGADTAGFVLKRFAAVFPYYLPCFLLRVLLATGVSPKAFLRELASSVPAALLIESTGAVSAYTLDGGWLISGILLAAMLLYPLLRKNRSLSCCVLAPAGVILFTGWASYVVGSLDIGAENAAFLQRGAYRAAAGLALGCVCDALSAKLAAHAFTKAGRALLSAAALAGYAAVLLSALRTGGAQSDFALLPLLALCVSITVSGQSALCAILERGWARFLGRLALPLLLAAGAAGRAALTAKSGPTAGLSGLPRVAACLACSLLLALGLLFAAGLLKKWREKRAARRADMRA